VKKLDTRASELLEEKKEAISLRARGKMEKRWRGRKKYGI
jgi:hypothetical protein